jgi:hypothetical protein
MRLWSFADVSTLSVGPGAERACVANDVRRFARFSGEVTHEAMIGKVVF